MLSLRKSDAISGNYFVRVTLKNSVYETPVSYPEDKAQALLESEQREIAEQPSNLVVMRYSCHEYFRRL